MKEGKKSVKDKNKNRFLGFIYVEVHVIVLFNISSQEMVKVFLYFVHYQKSFYYSEHNCSGPNHIESGRIIFLVLVLHPF